MMSTTAFDVATMVWETFGIEMIFFSFFCFGYILVMATGKGKGVASKKLSGEKEISADFASANYQAVVEKADDIEAVNGEVLMMVTQSLVELNRMSEVLAYVKKLAAKDSGVLSVDVAHGVLGSLASDTKLMEEAHEWFVAAGVTGDESTGDIMFKAYLDANDLTAIDDLLASGLTPSGKGYAMLTKAALKRKELDSGATYMRAMQVAGLYIPVNVATQYVKLGLEEGKAEETLSFVRELGLSGDCLAAVLELAFKKGEVGFVEGILSFDTEIPVSSYDVLVKMFAGKQDARAFQYFDAMVSADVEVTDSSCVAIMWQCVESKNVAFAEHVLGSQLERGHGSLATFTAMMKVYATVRMFHKTCELYAKIVACGVEPDTVMYGCLIKAAVEAGRLDLSREFLRKSGSPDIQNYMSLFRACGRERNVPKLLKLLKDLEDSSLQIDTTAYNCVLDVCVVCKDMRAVHELFSKMRASGYVDVISFNTLIKGLAAMRCEIASNILEDMRSLGLEPNQVTYNSLINATITTGAISRAWTYVHDMEKSGVQIDNFTCSIMVKSLKHSSSPENLDKTLQLIERANVIPDDVLVNTLLDACLRLRDVRRLNAVLETLKNAGSVPSPKAYGTLIRAYGRARNVEQARSVWNDMMAQGVRPTEQTFGCLLDAYIGNREMSGAMAVFNDFKACVPDFTACPEIYGALIRGFVQMKDLDNCIALYEEMKANRVEGTIGTYNLVIEACARTGSMDRAQQIFRELCGQGINPDLMTFSLIVKGYCVQGELEQALQLFNLMRKRSIEPDVGMFNAILDGCGRKEMRMLSEQVFADMEACNVAPTNFTLAILVKLYGRCHDLDAAFDMVEATSAKYNLEVSTQVYSCLMIACATNGDIKRALELLPKIGTPDAKTYSGLMNACLKHNQITDAIKLLDGAITARCTLDKELVEGVIFMAMRRGMSRETGPVVKRLQASGFALSERIAASITSPPKEEQTKSRVQARRQASQAWRS